MNRSDIDVVIRLPVDAGTGLDVLTHAVDEGRIVAALRHIRAVCVCVCVEVPYRARHRTGSPQLPARDAHGLVCGRRKLGTNKLR